MRDQINRSRGFARRSFIIGGAKMTLVAALISRLYYLQIRRSAEYKTLSDENRIRLRPIIPVRGKILDRNGFPVAENQHQFRTMMDISEATDPAVILERLASVLNLPERTHYSLFEKLISDNAPKFLIAKENLSWEEMAAVEVNIPDLPGVSIETAQLRHYPFLDQTSHLIGYIGSPTQKDVEKNPGLARADFKVGKSGVERELEEELRGKAGIKRTEVNAHGLSIRELSVEDSEMGNSVYLTIDARLQKFAAERIANVGGVKKSGASVVVVDVETGDVMALCSSPGFNPNLFVSGISSEEWANLVNDEDAPLVNKAIAREYPPGSTFKPIVALAALEEGVITPMTRFHCPGYLDHGSRRFHCWNEKGHGWRSLKNAIAQSCNVYFYNVAQKVGVDKIAAMAKKFGLDDVTGIMLPGEKSGLIPDKAWKKKTYGKDWYTGETLNTGIGQGYVLTTPVQLAVMAARLSSGGKAVKPQLVRDIHQPVMEGEVAPEEGSTFNRIKGFDDMNINMQHLEIVMEGMERVVNKPYGTAYGSRILAPKFAMAGKTGTAQVRVRRENENEPIPKKYRNHAIFIGFAPFDKPKYAISVVVEHGGSGSSAAAPIARDILLEAQSLIAKEGEKG